MRVKKEKLGVVKEMKCGIKGIIIWVSDNGEKVNVKFENGVIMKNRNYASFYCCSLNPKKPRLEMCKEGEKFTNNQGDLFIIKQVVNSIKILIEFQDEHKYQKFVAHSKIKRGNIFNPYHKAVYNIGYLGMDIPKSTDAYYTKCYSTWHGMLDRCYNTKSQEKQPTYIGCSVCEEWHNFQNFKKWFDENYYEIKNERMCLDKDILFNGNKIYSPTTCIIVPNRINVLFTKTNKFRGDCPIGVYYNRKLKKYISQCSEIQKNGEKSQTYLGLFHNKEDAFYAYKKHKEKVIKEIADEYKEGIPNKLYEALYKWEVNIND